MESDMAEPLSTSSAAATTGLMALLIGWLGPVGGDVMMVFLSSICGCFIAISGLRTTFLQALGLLGLGSFMSLLTSWAIASFAASQMPALSGPYLPSMIAILIGFSSNRLPKILKALTERVENKVGVKE
jgi:hypothetical protein